MANRNWTRGEAEALVHVADKPHQEQRDFVWASVKVGGIEVHDSDGMYCDKPSEFEGSEEHANAALIADAFNVAHETGRTPSELAALVERMREIIDEWQCWEDEPRASAFRLRDALLAELDAKPNVPDHPDDSEGGTV